jgi:hypothetical protein
MEVCGINRIRSDKQRVVGVLNMVASKVYPDNVIARLSSKVDRGAILSFYHRSFSSGGRLLKP